MIKRLQYLVDKEAALQQQIRVEDNPERKVKLLDEQYELLLLIENLLAQTEPIFLP